MMYGLPKNAQWIGGATLLSGALLAASSALTPLAAQQAWSASVETQAETAYRAVHARSLAKPKPAVRSARRKGSVAAPLHTSAIVPDLPVRKMPTPVEAAAADKPVADVFIPDESKVQVEAKAFAEPRMRTPNGLADVLTTQVLSEEQEAVAPAASAEPKPASQTTGDQYCSNIANAAADARFAWQKQTLLETEKKVEKSVEELNVKIIEYQKWMARRDEFSRKAQSAITDIYAKMKPDAAALQLSALDEETAAAVLIKLSPKISSALMAEMDAKKAARLTAIIAGSSKGPKGKPPAPPPSGGT
jgi:flagellar motility protein MotE (MotC chaperone)